MGDTGSWWPNWPPACDVDLTSKHREKNMQTATWPWVIKCPHFSHHPTIRYMVYNGYYKVMSNSPKMGHLPIPGWTHLLRILNDRSWCVSCVIRGHLWQWAPAARLIRSTNWRENLRLKAWWTLPQKRLRLPVKCLLQFWGFTHLSADGCLDAKSPVIKGWKQPAVQAHGGCQQHVGVVGRCCEIRDSCWKGTAQGIR